VTRLVVGPQVSLAVSRQVAGGFRPSRGNAQSRLAVSRAAALGKVLALFQQRLEEAAMLPIHTILHPTDFSDRSWYAFQLACALARDYHARVILLHVIHPPIVAYGEGVIPPDPESLVREADERLSELLARCDGVAVEKHVEEGDAREMILSYADECRADLIVMGTHGRTGVRRMLMGSVAEQVERRAACPVLMVSGPFPAAAAPEAQPAMPGAVMTGLAPA
jgi:nucleotide-binding universal stress UspA family protein